MTDHLLIELCKQNNRKAQLSLYAKYCEGMYTIACRYMDDSTEAEDCLQDAFIKVFQKMHHYKGEVTFGAWLKKVVVNTCLDRLKAKKAELISLNEDVLRIAAEEKGEVLVDDSVTVQQVKKAIEHLPEKYKVTTMLYLIEGYDHAEISEILNVSESASRILVHRGKKMIQEQLKHLRYGKRA